MCGSLWMWAVDLCKKEAVEGQPGGFLEDKTVTIVPYPKESDETCGENDLPRAPGLKQPEVFYRVKSIILAFLPKTSHWYKTLNKQSKDVPVLKWWADMDKRYLGATRAEIQAAQNEWQVERWKETTPILVHVDRMKDLFSTYYGLAGLEEADEDFWDQFVISLMDVILHADGTKYFVHTIETINTEIEALDSPSQINEDRVMKRIAKLTSLEKQLRNGNHMPSAEAVINMTNVPDGAVPHEPSPSNSGDHYFQKPDSGPSSDSGQGSSSQKKYKKKSNLNHFGVDHAEYAAMSEEEKNMAYTRFLIRTKLDKKLGIVLDPTKGTCRLGEKKDGKHVRCMTQYGTDHCRLKDKYNINVTRVDLSALRELQSGGQGLVELERDGQEVAPCSYCYMFYSWQTVPRW